MAGPLRHPIPLAPLEAYLSTAAPHIAAPLTIQQFGYGQSNPTYKLTDATGAHYVLRKKPPGQLLSATAHQVEREYRVLRALQATDVPAPRVYCLCEDEEVVGSAFYVMQYLDGRIFADPSIPGVTPAERTQMWTSALTTLATLHAVDIDANKALDGFGRKGGFYDRQIRTLSRIEAAQAATQDVETGAKVGRITGFDELMSHFSKTQPADTCTVIHGDYKIDNLVFHPTLPHVIGILDWELSTLGHPLSDLSNLLSPYIHTTTTKDPLFPHAASFAPSATPGLPAREEALAIYEKASGWTVPRGVVAWGGAFGLLRNAVIVQGVEARCARGQASSRDAGLYKGRAGGLAGRAWELVKVAVAEREREKGKL